MSNALNVDDGAAHSALFAAHADLLVHAESIAYRSVLDWIEALAARQQAAMTSCPRDKLGDAQVRLQQILAMRDALRSPDSSGTGFVCA